MRKILILVTAICLCSCDVTNTIENTTVKYYRYDTGGKVFTIEVEGHIYIVGGTYNGSGIIHAEHCPCKNK